MQALHPQKYQQSRGFESESIVKVVFGAMPFGQKSM
jgi:hypothetical protein